MSKMKSPSSLGYERTGAVQRASLSLSNASCASSDQWKSTCLLVSSVRGDCDFTEVGHKPAVKIYQAKVLLHLLTAGGNWPLLH